MNDGRARVAHLGWVLGLLALAGCDDTYHARLSDGAGLAKGSPVIVSSVRVGQVESLRVVEGQVDVEFSIDSDHEITLRADACAMARQTETGPELIVVPGTGAPLEEGRAMPECEPTRDDVGDLLRSLGESVGDLMRQLGHGLFGGAAPGGSTSGGTGGLPPLPFPLPPPPAPTSDVCDSIRVRIDRTERAAPVPIHLPDGGHRVWIELANDGDEDVRLGALGDATFTDASGRALASADLPGEPGGWFMPFTLPARERRSVSVTFPTADPPRLDRIEIERTAPAARPREQCTVVATGLATP
ncbi:MAG TPA: MlaD family protein [Sandaracinaceae bacterium]